VIASAPGKLIVTGEYAVLDGAPALVMAVDRRAVARRRKGPRGSSPFLIAVADEIAARHGADSPAAQAALEVAVDSARFFDGTTKLGLGSSASVTVAAAALALTALGGVLDRDAIFAVASAAHARAQGPRGTKGSGADIAAAVHGGVIAYRRHDELPQITKLRWPGGLTMISFFTGASADTATLVAQVEAARATNRVGVDAALAAITQASRAAIQACASSDPQLATDVLLASLVLAGRGVDELARASGVPLVPECVTKARAAMARLGGTAKTTGAGGGDVALAVIPAAEDRNAAERLLIEAGCRPIALTVDQTGVDLQPSAQ
jgi:phosphomevalonate kinase